MMKSLLKIMLAGLLVTLLAVSVCAATFTDVDSYQAFEAGGDPVFNMDDEADVADYWYGEWNGPGDTGDEITVEIVEGRGYNGTKGIAVSSNGTQNAGLYFYATEKNGIAKSYPGANYLRVWMDLSEVGFRKANFGVVNSLACLFTTDEVDGAWDCPFYYSSDGVNWTEMFHGGDGCFGDAQDSDVYGLAGFFAFPVKDFTIRASANWEAYDELTPCEPEDVWGVYMFWDYSDGREPGHTFVLDNFEFVEDYKVFDYEVVPTESSAEKVSYDLPAITSDPKAVLDSADVYLSFDDGVSDAKGHAVAAVGEVASVDGISGKAVKMNSTTGYITFDGYTFGTDSFTVTGWFNTESCEGDQCLFSNKDWGSGANPGWLVTQRGADWKVNINAVGGNRTDKEFGYSIIPGEFGFSSTNQWYFLAVVVDRAAGTYKLYVNGRDFYVPGEFTADNAFDGLSFDSDLPFNIGQDGTGAYSDGTLVTTYDEIAIFKKALTAEEIAALYTLNATETSGGSASDNGGAALLWDFNEDEAISANMGANSNNAVNFWGEKDDAGNDYYVFVAGGNDPYVSVDLSAADVSDVVWAKARVKNPGPATALELFGHTGGRGLTGSECTHINVAADNEWHTYIIYIPDENVATVNAYKDPQYAITEPYWAGTVDWIRLDPMWQEGDDGSDSGGSMNSGDEIYIDYIAFFPTEEAAKAFRADQDNAAAAPAEEPAAPTYTYPASGADGSVITGTVIGNAEGWGGNADAGAAAAFDGNPATFFDPLGVGDGFCGIDAGEPYVLDKVVILSRADWNDRFPGAMIQGSNDGENWTTLWTSDTTGTNPDYYTVTEFENNTGYSQFRYFNETNHGDVAEVEFYGTAGSEDAPAAESKGFADVTAAADGKNVITGYKFVSGTNGFGGEGAENLWDGDTATKFCTNEFPVESIAKLDGTYDITGFTMATANDNADYNGRSPSDWTIYVSADGENWTEFAKGDDSFFEETNFTYYVGEGTASGVSYVKFTASATPANLFQVSEVTLFGDKAADVTEELTTKEEAPQTFDFGIVAAVAALISVCGFAVSKKKH